MANAGQPVTVRYWAAAKDAAGCASERLEVATLGELVARAGQQHGPKLARLLQICSFIVDGAPVKRADADALSLNGGSQVEVLPPFAGGSDVKPLGA